MEGTFLSLLHGFSVAFEPSNLWYAFLGCLVGTLVGVLPGIGPLAGISILLPVTFGLNATQAIIMLAGIYYGSQYGGSTTSILMRIPGEAVLGDDLHRRLRHVAQGPRRRRALHRRGRLLDRRHLRRDRADAGGAAAGDAGSAASGRPNTRRCSCSA